jgi:hypothetical protein
MERRLKSSGEWRVSFHEKEFPAVEQVAEHN